MKRPEHIFAGRIIAVGILAALAAACSRDAGPVSGTRPESPTVPIEFRAYTGQAADIVGCCGPVASAPADGALTRGATMDPSAILGHWEDSTSTFVPGTGIGVFAFHQKAKSNGYPVDFNKYIGEPTFMNNQKLERLTDDGVAYRFDYTPHKYWPNTPHDRISFFAYAPYDEATAWEDLHIESNLNGTKITRGFIIEEEVEDQTDFLWADPVLNMEKPESYSPVNFSFSHICSRLSVSAQVNEKAKSIYVTVDKVTIRGKFTTSGTMAYIPETGVRSWARLEGFDKASTYVPFESFHTPDPESGTPVLHTFVVDTLKQYVHDSMDGGDRAVCSFVFVLPGTQDIELTAVVSQRSSTTDFVKSYEINRTFPAMELQENKSYNFFLSITLTPVTFSGSVDATWSAGEETYKSPDNGQTWTH